ncbi:LysR family transcriptional regulator [Thaumasiovibrio subtropicus]|uniref:LysR family transcriptional regulator n=1 Tax=Thaumasiovibrio subtropicus TaxID=1891207 RepID=UPI000B354319|nr:LysR family transcriptional regulator [Thaumasiovibrio subtropicus]
MLDKMAFFVCVIRSGSISAAARKYAISVSAGSRWLQDLEAHFGMILLRRTNRLLTPTPAGKKLFEEFAPLVDNAEQLQRSLQDFQEHDKGHINIACTPVFANHYLMSLIGDYIKTHPSVTFNINVTPWALDYAGDVDLMISANANYQGYQEKDLHLVRREIMQCPFVPVASPCYLAAHSKPLKPEDLVNHRCLFASTLTGSNDWIFTRDEESQMIKIPKNLEVNDSDLLLQGVLEGTGIGYLPQRFITQEIENGLIVPLLEDYKTSIWSLNLYYHPPKKASAVASHFKSFLLDASYHQ